MWITLSLRHLDTRACLPGFATWQPKDTFQSKGTRCRLRMPTQSEKRHLWNVGVAWSSGCSKPTPRAVRGTRRGFEMRCGKERIHQSSTGADQGGTILRRFASWKDHFKPFVSADANLRSSRLAGNRKGGSKLRFRFSASTSTTVAAIPPSAPERA